MALQGNLQSFAFFFLEAVDNSHISFRRPLINKVIAISMSVQKGGQLVRSTASCIIFTLFACFAAFLF
jgi:hypothetical protein